MVPEVHLDKQEGISFVAQSTYVDHDWSASPVHDGSDSSEWMSSERDCAN